MTAEAPFEAALLALPPLRLHSPDEVFLSIKVSTPSIEEYSAQPGLGALPSFALSVLRELRIDPAFATAHLLDVAALLSFITRPNDPERACLAVWRALSAAYQQDSDPDADDDPPSSSPSPPSSPRPPDQHDSPDQNDSPDPSSAPPSSSSFSSSSALPPAAAGSPASPPLSGGRQPSMPLLDRRSFQSLPLAQTIKAGYLQKKGGGKRRANWKRRWFVLERHKLAYYVAPDRRILKGSLQLGEDCRLCLGAEGKITRRQSSRQEILLFTVVTPQRRLLLCASSTQDLKDWMRALSSCLCMEGPDAEAAAAEDAAAAQSSTSPALLLSLASSPSSPNATIHPTTIPNTNTIPNSNTIPNTNTNTNTNSNSNSNTNTIPNTIPNTNTNTTLSNINPHNDHTNQSPDEPSSEAPLSASLLSSSSPSLLSSSSSSCTSPSPLLQAGFLDKLGGSGKLIWQKRWFVLSEDRTLCWFADGRSKVPRNSATLAASGLVLQDATMRLTVPLLRHLPVVLRAPDESSYRHWAAHLSGLVAAYEAAEQQQGEPAEELLRLHPELRGCVAQGVDPARLFVDRQPIGKGAFGEVFKTRYVENGEAMAVKLIHYSRRHHELIAAEIHALHRCDHPQIIGLLGCWLWKDWIWLSTVFCDSKTLRDAARLLPPGEQVLAGFGYQVLRGLSYLSMLRVIHRDIKGDNILLSRDGSVRIADLGLAVDIERSRDRGQSGSAGFMAPEVLARRSYGTRADVYGFGVLLYATLHPNFENDSFPLLSFKNMFMGLDMARLEVSQALASLILQCTIPDPRERPTATDIMLNPWFTIAAPKEKLAHYAKQVAQEESITSLM